MKSTQQLSFILFIPLLLNSAVSEDNSQNIWPIGKAQDPDLIQTNGFGPRIKVSEEYRYDWHRGIDIPVDVGTSLYAIADGVVTKAGDYDSYTDTVIQVEHTFGSDDKYYANYIHCDNVLVSENQQVHKSQQLGTSGVSVSGFAHLHFEIRKNGVFQRNCINPWSILPHNNEPSEEKNVKIENYTNLNDGKWNFTVYTSQSGDYLTLNIIRLEFQNSDGTVLDYHEADFEQMTYEAEEWEILDNRVQGNIEFHPQYFGSQQHERMEYYVIFFEIAPPSDTRFAVARVVDVDGQFKEVKITFTVDDEKYGSAMLVSVLGLMHFLFLFTFCFN